MVRKDSVGVYPQLLNFILFNDTLLYHNTVFCVVLLVTECVYPQWCEVHWFSDVLAMKTQYFPIIAVLYVYYCYENMLEKVIHGAP